MYIYIYGIWHTAESDTCRIEHFTLNLTHRSFGAASLHWYISPSCKVTLPYPLEMWKLTLQAYSQTKEIPGHEVCSSWPPEWHPPWQQRSSCRGPWSRGWSLHHVSKPSRGGAQTPNQGTGWTHWGWGSLLSCLCYRPERRVSHQPMNKTYTVPYRRLVAAEVTDEQ